MPGHYEKNERKFAAGQGVGPMPESVNEKLSKNPHKKGSEFHEVYKRNVLTDAYYDDKISQKDYSRLIKESVKREEKEKSPEAMDKKSSSMVNYNQLKRDDPRAFQTTVDMQVEEDIKNNSRWKDFSPKEKKEIRKRLTDRYTNSPANINDKWYMATFQVYESKDFSKYMKKDAYTKGADKGRRGSSAHFGNGKGKGWHGEQIRHRNAAMKGRGMRR